MPFNFIRLVQLRQARHRNNPQMKLYPISSIPFHCTKIYPIDLMFLLPLSGDAVAALPHVLLSSGYPAVPNPILESQLLQSVWSLPLIPILALDGSLERPQIVLKPSSLQLVCNEPREPNSVFHVWRPKEVAR